MCSPSSGGAVRIGTGVTVELDRDADLAQHAEGRVLDLDGHPSAPAPAGDSNALEDVGDRPARDPGRSRAASHSAVGRVAKPLGEQRAQDGAGLDPVAVRRESRIVGQLGGADAPRRTAATAARDPTATAISPSAVANVSYGTMFGWALPRRPGAAPVTNAFCAWLTRIARVDAEQRDVDALARRTGPVGRRASERAEDPDRREQPGHDVADRDPDLGRTAAVGVGVAGDRHQPADGLDRRSRSRAGRRPGRLARSR